MNDLFERTWVLITGASSGMGLEFARRLAARKANLILTARSGDKLDALARELAQAHGIETETIALDLGAAGGADRLLAEVARRGRAVDHLISNAGFGSAGRFAEAPAAREAEMVRLNCEALLVLSRGILPQLLERRAGGILHVASIAGMQPVPFMATYGATKAFVLSFSLALSEETRGSGVRVMALCPGPVPTGFQQVTGYAISQSQKRAVLSAEETVARGLAAYERGRDVFIPGGLNTVGAWASKHLPVRTVTRMVGRMMRERANP
ncbi:MAG TPA: SDR family oxidoreductase [Polyangia bacterium]|nr:SDR family oxidoreductase [Polyangia bacterium]